MIIGVGVDIASPERIRKSYEKFGDRFLNRIYTPGEIEYCSSKANKFQSFAARFAAKEAVMKALKYGISSGAIFKEVEIIPGEPPLVLVTGKTADEAKAQGVKNYHLSLSHEKSMSVAFVILEG